MTYQGYVKEDFPQGTQFYYGIDIVEKPELGKKPSWLEEKNSIPTKTRTKYESLKLQKSDNIKRDEFRKFLLSIKEKIELVNKCDKVILHQTSIKKRYYDFLLRIKKSIT